MCFWMMIAQDQKDDDQQHQHDDLHRQRRAGEKGEHGEIDLLRQSQGFGFPSRLLVCSGRIWSRGLIAVILSGIEGECQHICVTRGAAPPTLRRRHQLSRQRPLRTASRRRTAAPASVSVTTSVTAAVEQPLARRAARPGAARSARRPDAPARSPPPARRRTARGAGNPPRPAARQRRCPPRSRSAT